MFDINQANIIQTMSDLHVKVVLFQKTSNGLNMRKAVEKLMGLQERHNIILISQSELGFILQSAIAHDQNQQEAVSFNYSKVVDGVKLGDISIISSGTDGNSNFNA